MKAKNLILCFVAMATMLFAGCSKDNNSNALAGTTWQLDNPHDEAFAYYGDYHVIYTVAFGQNNEVTFTREITCEELDYYQKPVMTGTYTYGKDSKGVAMVCNEGETTEYRFAFSVSGNTMIWNFNLRDLTLTKL